VKRGIERSIMKFAELAEAYDGFERTSGNALRDAVGKLFAKVPAADIKIVSYMTLGAIASSYDDINLGVADKMAVRAIAKASGKNEAAVMADYKKNGDIGTTAEDCAGANKASLTVKDVFLAMHKIATASGAGSQDEKVRLLAVLLSKATPLEARYIGRLVMGQLRLGVAAKTILTGLAQAFDAGAAGKQALDNAFNTCPDIGLLAETLAQKGIAGVRKLGVMVGRPVQMMLCQRVNSIDEALQKLGTPVVAEQKYDGERVQAHKQGSKVTLFSRRLEDITAQYPDIIKAILKDIKAKSCIMEAEIMAIRNGELQPFQMLMSRRRTHEVEKYAKEIPVKPFWFDLLFLNGKSLIDEPYTKRYALLQKATRQSKNTGLAKRVVCNDSECVEELFNEVVGKGGEGVVLKSLRKDSSYEAGVRGWHWVKWKPEYTKGMRETFDLVPIGAYWGKGRRAGSYGTLLCAVYNDKTGIFETFCKLGSGFKDSDLENMPKILKKAGKQPNSTSVTKQMKPDVWFAPTKVLEVLGAQITESPYHTTALNRKTGRGLALRFPRFVRWRNDKKPEQATTTEEIVRMKGKR